MNKILTSEKPTERDYETLSRSGIVETIAIDGLDGSGKGSCAKEMANILASQGSDVLLVEYPNYELPWGRYLKYLLVENDDVLSIEERMAVYALNRLETLTAIQEWCVIKNIENELSGSKKPLKIIFDRFVTSNVITLAYYLDKQNVDPNEHAYLARIYYDYMWDTLDKTFAEKLKLYGSPIFIPVLPHSMSLKALSEDSSRKVIDSYEKERVQALSAKLYNIVSQYDSYSLSLIYQIIDEDGVPRRMGKQELAREILNYLNVIKKDTPMISGEVSILSISTLWDKDIENMKKLLQKIKSQKLWDKFAELYPSHDSIR